MSLGSEFDISARLPAHQEGLSDEERAKIAAGVRSEMSKALQLGALSSSCVALLAPYFAPGPSSPELCMFGLGRASLRMTTWWGPWREAGGPYYLSSGTWTSEEKHFVSTNTTARLKHSGSNIFLCPPL